MPKSYQDFLEQDHVRRAKNSSLIYKIGEALGLDEASQRQILETALDFFKDGGDHDTKMSKYLVDQKDKQRAANNRIRYLESRQSRNSNVARNRIIELERKLAAVNAVNAQYFAMFGPIPAHMVNPGFNPMIHQHVPPMIPPPLSGRLMPAQTLHGNPFPGQMSSADETTVLQPPSQESTDLTLNQNLFQALSALFSQNLSELSQRQHQTKNEDPPMPHLIPEGLSEISPHRLPEFPIQGQYHQPLDLSQNQRENLAAPSSAPDYQTSETAPKL